LKKVGYWFWVRKFFNTSIKKAGFRAATLMYISKNILFSKIYFSTKSKKIVSTAIQQPNRLPSGYKPINSFALYVKENTKNTNGEDSSILVKKIASVWNNMSDIEKEVYIFIIF
jgi:hypothetical protein